MNPRAIAIADFNYSLPEEKIAAYPLKERDASKLLIWREGLITEDIYRNISFYIPRGSTLALNATKVVEARILFKKPTGGVVEIFALEPGDMYPDLQAAMQQKQKVWWKCLVGGASKWKHGQVLEKMQVTFSGSVSLTATIRDRLAENFLIELAWNPGELTFAEILHCMGVVPLPPYIKREVEASDSERYQTIYARNEGSVAAPTAGLHFTESIFNSLREKEINCAYVTLHVGAGTFKPVKSATLNDHEMHSEYIDVSLDTVRQLRTAKNLFAVGTTSLRTLESLYWIGTKLCFGSDHTPKQLGLSQWEVYEKLSNKILKPEDALTGLVSWMEMLGLQRLITQTQLLIAPGYQCRMVRGLITNFHLPQSTLLLLVAALAGNDWKKIYDHALKNNYRFLSYGDGCLIFTASKEFPP
jgi:S-adenosylmethionine:tRNA ribosyltransferase-isomerase